MSLSTTKLVRFVQSRLRAAADPAKARPMQAYLKTKMPMYGIQRPAQVVIFREMCRRFVPGDQRQYEAAVRALWKLSRREEKYAAIDFATRHKPFVTSRSLPLYEHLVRERPW